MKPTNQNKQVKFKKQLSFGDRHMNPDVREGVVVAGGGGAKCFCLYLCAEETRREKLSGQVQLEGHSPRWPVLQNFSFQP